MSSNANGRVAVVAVGGNSLIRDKNQKSIPDQYAAASETMEHMAGMIQAGWNIIITHGNGPQVGFILRRAELALDELHPVPLDYCGADTQGAIGYMFQRSLHNEFRSRSMDNQAVTVVTQVLVDRADPAFESPSKPIGSFMDESMAQERAAEGGWVIGEDAGRGWRRVVPSPMPIEIIEKDMINMLVKGGFTVVSVGGGGIPVVRNEQGNLVGVEAVIDKDFASSLLATELGAEMFLISTAVEKVALNFNTEDETMIDQMTVAEAQRYLDEGHFAPGSMKPKVQAVLGYLERGGKEAIITDPANLERALAGETGTRVVP